MDFNSNTSKLYIRANDPKADSISYTDLINALQLADNGSLLIDTDSELIARAKSIEATMWRRSGNTRSAIRRIKDFCNAFIIESIFKEYYKGSKFIDEDTHVNFSATASNNPDLQLSDVKTLEIKAYVGTVEEFIDQFTMQSKYDSNYNILNFKAFNNYFGSAHDADKLLIYSKADKQFIIGYRPMGKTWYHFYINNAKFKEALEIDGLF